MIRKEGQVAGLWVVQEADKIHMGQITGEVAA